MARGDYAVFIAEQAGVGNKTIALKNCRNVLLRDFSALKGGHFVLLATGVDNLTIDNLLIDTDRDGLDIDCCRNVRVSNCTVNSPWDDAICPKSSYALGYQRATDYVTIANNYVCGYYELGSVLAGTWKKFDGRSAGIAARAASSAAQNRTADFRNIAITGNVLEGCKGISLESSDGAYIEDIAITGNTMRDIVDAPLFLRLNRRNRGPKETMRPGTLRRVVISNLVSHNSGCFNGFDHSRGYPVESDRRCKALELFLRAQGLPKRMRVRWGDSILRRCPTGAPSRCRRTKTHILSLLRMGPTPSHGFFVRHLRNLEMSHVEVAPTAPDPRPAIWLEDVHRADFFAITAPPQGNFSLHGVSDFRLAWSRAAKDTNHRKGRQSGHLAKFQGSRL